MQLLGVVGRRLDLNGGMTPDAIVEHFDVLKNDLLRVITSFKIEVWNAASALARMAIKFSS